MIVGSCPPRPTARAAKPVIAEKGIANLIGHFDLHQLV
jgi:hypothetical protein